jgi:tetratricopeptide (TPR) repeat protein
LKKAIELDTKRSPAYNNLANVYADLGRHKDAIANYTKAIEVDPRDALAHANRALVRARDKDFKGAIDDYAAALTIEPRSAKALLGRGQCYLAQKQLERAAADLRQGAQLAKDPGDFNVAAWFFATCPEVKLRDPQQALSLAEKAVHAGPNRHDYLNTLGVVYYRLGEHAKAIETLQKAIRTDKTGGSPWDFFFLAMAQWQLGQKEEARKWYHQAVEWMEQRKPQGEALEDLGPFRAEAQELLGIGKKPEPGKEKPGRK